MVALRPRVERRHVFIGAITDPDVVSYVASLGQAERDRLLELALDSLIDVSDARSARLTSSGFVVTGDDRLASAFRALGDFEVAVTSALARKKK
jgi:hypothetical protein